MTDADIFLMKHAGSNVEREFVYADIARDLQTKLDGERGVLEACVIELGGTVEGQPTHRGNLLQRIRELRAMERKDVHEHVERYPRGWTPEDEGHG